MNDKLTNTIKEYKDQIIDCCAEVAEDIILDEKNANCCKVCWEIVEAIRALKEAEK